MKGKGGGEKTIDRTEKHRPQPKKQTKILNKNVTKDITKSSQIPPDRRTFPLTPMLSSSPKCEEERFGDRNDHGEKAVNRKKTGKTKKQKTYSSALVELDFQFVEASENVDAKKSS